MTKSLFDYAVVGIFPNFGFILSCKSFIETGFPRVLPAVILFLLFVLNVGYIRSLLNLSLSSVIQTLKRKFLLLVVLFLFFINLKIFGFLLSIY